MRTSFFLLLIAGTVLCLKVEASRESMCEIWSGIGATFSGKECASLIASTCPTIYDVFPKIIDLIVHFDPSKLIPLIQDVVVAVIGVIEQTKHCQYSKYFANVFKNIYDFFAHLGEGWVKIEPKVACILMAWFSGDYYQEGTCIGGLWKIVMAIE